jgi:hypothetical protein
MGRAMTNQHRRGVLLLVVLSMLTLFLMLGATYLVAASRARRAARAFADSAATATGFSVPGEQLVDAALLAVMRGTTSGTLPIANGQTILGDRYGTATVSGTMSANASGTIIIEIPSQRISNASLLAGRVITFALPGLGMPSTRIIRAEDSSSGTKLYIPGGPTISGDSLTAAGINAAKAKAASGSTHFYVNGRDFDDSGANEPYDSATGSDTLFLAKLESTGSSIRQSFSQTGTIDNDGDAFPDSGFIPLGLPVVRDAAGNSLTVKAAVLVVDLDGRLNLNTHGSSSDVATPEKSAFGGSSDLYPDFNPGGGVIPVSELSRGLGLGPAEVAVGASAVTGTMTGTGFPEMLGGTTATKIDPDSGSGRPTPVVGNAEGRYGDAAWSGNLVSLPQPGYPAFDDNATIDRWVSSTGTASSQRFFEDGYTRYGSPPDVKGRMRIWVDPHGQPVYYKPAWNAGGGGGYSGDELVDDPYEVDLGPRGSRTGYVRTPSANTSTARDNPYTVAELEGLLRYFDPDSTKLPRRLVTICRNWASSNRLLVTTDSWDTPGVVGKAWKEAIGSPFATALVSGTAATGSRPFELFAPETLMGHKLDLNRPFHTTDVREPSDATGIRLRQQFAKHLYCLLVAIASKNKNDSLTAAESEQLAQWAVNVVDFRDADSVMTPFDYDENFAPGSEAWNATKRVWGCERPEVLIMETLAWHDRRTDDTASDGASVKQMNATTADNDFDQQRRPRGAFFVTLYSPWGSQAQQYDAGGSPSVVVDVTKSGTTTPAYRGEPLPLELTGTNVDRFSRTATISLSLRHDRSISTSGTASPIWRLVSVRGDATGSGTNSVGQDGFGTDPVRPALVSGSSSGTLSILDPSRPNGAAATVGTGTAVLDRIFYFTTPPSAQQNEKPGYVFWQSYNSDVDPGLSSFVTVGTDRLAPNSFTQVVATGTNAKAQRTFDKPDYKPATLSEPIVTTANVDAYQAVAAVASGTTAQFANTGTDLYSASYTLNTTVDPPLDSATTAVTNGSKPFLDANGRPLLMQNGTHANFAVIHLQRLADPGKAWNATTNPYLTVDSMTTDLTVVNTASDGNSWDEPGRTPDPDNGSQFSWLRTQKQFRTTSVQRGGLTAQNNTPEPDIWNRRVTASGSDVRLDTLFRTGTTSARSVAFTPAVPGVQEAILTPTNVALTTTSGTFPERLNANTVKRFPWLLWPNRPYFSPAELSAVPTTGSFHLLRLHSTAASSSPLTPSFHHLPGLLESSTTSPWNHLSGTAANVLDFVHVPTRFSGCYTTIPLTPSTSAILEAHGLADQPYNHISLFREPGRVNINTVAHDSVRKALLGTTSGTAPAWNPSALNTAQFSWMEAIKAVNPNSVDTFSNPYRNSSLDSFFRFQTAGRLSNNLTTRSNVFAVWITVGYFDGSTEREPIRRNRGFFIVDRSIPVGHVPGKDLNVKDAIILRRIIE